MGEVIKLNVMNSPKPDSVEKYFAISAHSSTDGNWAIRVTEFYDPAKNEADIFREVAEHLTPIAGGMIHNAEEIEPTARGKLVVTINMFNDGTVDLISSPIKTAKQKSWFKFMLTNVIRDITGAKKRKR
jgi:hypothetical protein